MIDPEMELWGLLQQVSAMKYKVLVVDDYAPEREAMAELLDLWGYEVETAEDGLEALEKIFASSPNLVLSELSLPLMGGIELLQELKRRSRMMPFIIVTSEVAPSERSEALALGAFALLEKPINPEQLKVEVEKCLQSWQRHSMEASAGWRSVK